MSPRRKKKRKGRILRRILRLPLLLCLLLALAGGVQLYRSWTRQAPETTQSALKTAAYRLESDGEAWFEPSLMIRVCDPDRSAVLSGYLPIALQRRYNVFLIPSDIYTADVVFSPDTGITAADGAVELDGYLDGYLDGLDAVKDLIGEERIAYWRQADGHIYLFPYLPEDAVPEAWAVRGDWLTQLRRTAPGSAEEWMETWRAMLPRDLNVNGDPSDEIPLALGCGSGGNPDLRLLMNACGIRASLDGFFCVTDDGRYTLVYEHPAWEDCLFLAADLFREEILDPEFRYRDREAQYAAMDVNLAGSTLTDARRIRISSARLKEKGILDGSWSITAPPAFTDNGGLTADTRSIQGGWYLTKQAAESGRLDDILAFLNRMYREENRELMAYGPERIGMVRSGDKDSRELLSGGTEAAHSAGLWPEVLEEAYRQYLDPEEARTYSEAKSANAGHTYVPPETYETQAWEKYKSLAVSDMNRLIREVITGTKTPEEYREEYSRLYENGLREIIQDGAAVYAQRNAR